MLMLSLDDAVNVAKQLVINEMDDEEIIRTELEQKAWIPSKYDEPVRVLAGMIGAITPAEITEQILANKLGDWCEKVQAVMNIALMQITREQPTIEPEPKWIPCSERLPEAGSWAIWCSNKGIIQVARWKIDAIDHFFPSQGFFQLDDAVAWMPLPEPYKESEE